MAAQLKFMGLMGRGSTKLYAMLLVGVMALAPAGVAFAEPVLVAEPALRAEPIFPAAAQSPATGFGQQMPGGMQQQQNRQSQQQAGQDRQTSAQDRLRGNRPAAEEEADTPFFGEGSEVAAEDTVKKRRQKMPLESYHFPDSVRARLNMRWTVDPYTNNIETGHIDTLQADFQNEYPFMKKGVGSAYLGNLGAPSEYLSYFDREQSTRHTFADAWGAYLRTPATLPFYNTKTPFTQFGYVWAGQKAKQEEDFVAIHAQNISPQTGFNIDYRSLGTKGIYQWEATRDKTLSMAINHTGKRYTVHAGYIWNSVYNRENGGLADDNDVIVDEQYNRWEMSQVIPMRLSDPRNWIKNNSYFLSQSYGVPLRRVRAEDFTIADRPAFFLGHTLQYDRWARRYEDTYNGTIYQPVGGAPTDSYYGDWYYNPTQSVDSLFESRLANRVFLQLQPWDRGGVVGTVDAGVGVDLVRYYRFSPEQFLTGPGVNVKETEYYGYAGINGYVGRYFNYTARAMFHPFGARSGDTEIEGRATARLFVKGRPLSVSGAFSFTSLGPGYWEQNFSTNHFMWSNSFSKENETRIDVSLRVPHIGLEATASQSILGGKVYYDESARPAQAADAVSVTGVYLREDLQIGIGSSSVNFNHRVQLQWSSNEKVVPVPLASAYLSYFFEFNVVRDVLRLQIGLDGRYNTRYWAPGYNPGTAQFYNQRERQLGDYVWVDAFVNAKWKRMRIIFKMQHLNDDMFGTRNYFTVLHYPTNRRVLKIGLSWNFYD